jgi:hypothetical protein
VRVLVVGKFDPTHYGVTLGGNVDTFHYGAVGYANRSITGWPLPSSVT